MLRHSVAVLIALLFCWSGPAGAERIRTQELCSGVSTAGVAGESGASIFVIDATKYEALGGDVMLQLTGVTPDSNALSTTGLTIYYASSAFSSDATHWSWRLASWTALTSNLLMKTGATVYSFDVPSNPAAPFVGIKVIGGPYSGTSTFKLGLKATLR